MHTSSVRASWSRLLQFVIQFVEALFSGFVSWPVTWLEDVAETKYIFILYIMFIVFVAVDVCWSLFLFCCYNLNLRTDFRVDFFGRVTGTSSLTRLFYWQYERLEKGWTWILRKLYTIINQGFKVILYFVLFSNRKTNSFESHHDRITDKHCSVLFRKKHKEGNDQLLTRHFWLDQWHSGHEQLHFTQTVAETSSYKYIKSILVVVVFTRFTTTCWRNRFFRFLFFFIILIYISKWASAPVHLK